VAVDLPAVPDDVEALKAALIAARAEAAAVGAELARACATAANDRSLIAHLKLEIEKLRRAIYGPRSEGAARLIEQPELQLEEAEADARKRNSPPNRRSAPLSKPLNASGRRESRFPIICRASGRHSRAGDLPVLRLG
jgi:hypothetical protein